MQSWQNEWDIFNIEAAEPQKNAEVQRTKIKQIESSLQGLDQRLLRMNDELQTTDISHQETESSSINILIEKEKNILNEINAKLVSVNDQLSKKKNITKDSLDKINIERVSLQEKKASLPHSKHFKKPLLSIMKNYSLNGKIKMDLKILRNF